MRDSLSINEALDQLDRLDWEPMALHGILHFEFEHVAIWHYPNSERRNAELFGKASSSTWLSTGWGSV